VGGGEGGDRERDGWKEKEMVTEEGEMTERKD
jgi:hypothetical protein